MIVRVLLPGVSEATAVSFIQARGLRGKVTSGVRCVAAPNVNLVGVEVEMYGNNIWRDIRSALQSAIQAGALSAAVVLIEGEGRNPFFVGTGEGAPLGGAILFGADGSVTSL